jgi:tetratricopeptide (TPR) repeat protein
MTAEESNPQKATEFRKAAIDCGEKAFAFLQGVQIRPEDQVEFEALAVPALFHLALNYDQLGNRKKALDSCKKALELSPESPDALMLYGFLTFDEFPDARRNDFIESQRNQFIGESFDRVLSTPGLSPLLN